MIFYKKFLLYIDKPQSYSFKLINTIINFYNKIDFVVIINSINLNCYDNNLNMSVIGFNFNIDY